MTGTTKGSDGRDVPLGGGALGDGQTSFKDPLPYVMAAALVTWGDICLGRMPSLNAVRDALIGADFRQEPYQTAREAGELLALDNRLVAMQLRDIHHELWRMEHKGVPVVMLLSSATSDTGQVSFAGALFGGATEAEAVKAIVHMSKTEPREGGLATNREGKVWRRIFWKLGGMAGMQAVALCGPEDVEARDHLRAVIAISRAK